MLHKHHIIPRHAGGTDDPSNLVELTVEEHAEAHKKLYEQYGRWQDKLAWKCLSGHIGREEAIKYAQKHADKSWMQTEEGKLILSMRWETRRKNNTHIPWNKGLKKSESAGLRRISKINKRMRKEGRLSNIGDVVRGTTFSDEHKKKLSERARNRKKIKCKCGVECLPGPYARWHGSNCKNGDDATALGRKK
jgi:hypothetical protein